MRIQRGKKRDRAINLNIMNSIIEYLVFSYQFTVRVYVHLCESALVHDGCGTHTQQSQTTIEKKDEKSESEREKTYQVNKRASSSTESIKYTFILLYSTNQS